MYTYMTLQAFALLGNIQIIKNWMVKLQEQATFWI